MSKRKDESPEQAELYDWSLEEPLDEPATLEDLVKAPVFKQASDKLGHSITAATRVPIWLNRRIAKLRETPGAPYEVTSDVIRDALYLGLRILHLRYTIAEDWDLDTKLANIRDLAAASRRIREHFDEFEGNLEDLFRGGDEVQAAHNLASYVITASRMENEWHKSKIVGLIGHSRICREVAEYCDKETRAIVDRIIEEGKITSTGKTDSEKKGGKG
jgi:hypothetical protein